MNWIIKSRVPDEFIGSFPEYEAIILRLLYNRGLRDQRAIDEFFNPDYKEDLHDPFLMLGMKKAVKRILKAAKNNEYIAIFGDYDADGICSSAILEKTLKLLGSSHLDVYIPDRAREGYGLNLDAIAELAKRGAKLIISVDCGITDFEEIKLANSLGMETIIVDHHEIIGKTPNALAVVDPHQEKDKYPFKELSAAGVTFKLVQALLEVARKEKKWEERIKEGWEKWLLDYVAIATVADCCPLIGENRTLVKYGLVVLAQTNKIGLRELMKTARINPTFDLRSLETNLDSFTLGFILGPRLNAASRMQHANIAYQLVVTESEEEAKKLAIEINGKNLERQNLTEKITQELNDRLSKKEEFPFVIFEGSAEWPVGLIGLVAGRATDRYSRPSIIFSEMENFNKASARSIPKFDLVEAMKKIGHLFIEFGGHPLAAGFSFKKENTRAIAIEFEKMARAALKEEDLSIELEVDSKIGPAEIKFELFDRLQRFAPFGEGNPRPSFWLENLEVVAVKNVGNNEKHLKFELKIESLPGKIFKAIGFNQASKNGHIKIGDKIDIVFELIVNEWNGSRELQLKIVDIHKIEANL
ncbi:MAG: single-stranded-DNA-specific exonuclease RecJ [Candidatus Portnoybacteria bacterium]|nr:single-stranded-DNA-specific exonuclease RecJ [Candidatus Portnoybacteria bacterium]